MSPFQVYCVTLPLASCRAKTDARKIKITPKVCLIEILSEKNIAPNKRVQTGSDPFKNIPPCATGAYKNPPKTQNI